MLETRRDPVGDLLAGLGDLEGHTGEKLLARYFSDEDDTVDDGRIQAKVTQF